MQALTQFIAPLAGVITLFLLVLSLKRWPGIGLMLLAGFAITAWEFQIPAPLASVAGLSIYPQDVVLAALAVDAIGRLGAINRAMGGRSVALLLFTVLVGVSLVRGLVTFSIGEVVTESRFLLQLMVATAWMMSLHDDPGFERLLRRYCLLGAAAISLMAIYHVIRYGLGSADGGQLLINGDTVTNRPLISAQVAFIALAAIALLARRERKLFVLGLLGIVLVAQHRTAWAATAFGLGILFFRGGLRVKTSLIVGAIYLAALTWALIALGVGADVTADLQRSFESRQTLTGRNEGWAALVQQLNDKGAYYVVLGDPFGSGWTRSESGRVANYSPHSWYVALYLRVGFIGMATLAVVLVTALGRLWSSRGDRATEIAWLGALLVYAFAYNVDWVLAPFLAAALIAPSAQPGVGLACGHDRRDVIPRHFAQRVQRIDPPVD